MKVLLDENLPRRLINLLPGHEVWTVPQYGWAGVKNGKLLALADTEFQTFITLDRGLPYQQNLAGMTLMVLVLQAPSNRLQDVAPLASPILHALESWEAGMIRYLPADERI